jgi:hypothetical protein
MLDPEGMLNGCKRKMRMTKAMATADRPAARKPGSKEVYLIGNL